MTGGSQMGCQQRICGGSSWIRALPLCQHCLFLRRINDCVRPVFVRECAGPHTHVRTPTASHTFPASDLHRHNRPPPCHIYPQQCGGEEPLLLVCNKQRTSEWEEAQRSLISPLSKRQPPHQKTPPFLVVLLVSRQMKWTNAKSMFLVSLTDVVSPLSHCFPTD